MRLCRNDVALLVLAALLGGAPADAAVKLCRPEVVSDDFAARTEPEARKLAISHWELLAGLHGVGYKSWRLAGNRRITCRYLADGLRHCQARGSPCTISQVVPPRAMPMPKRVPVPDEPAPRSPPPAGSPRPPGIPI